MRMEKTAEEERHVRRLQTEAALSEGELNFQLLANSIPQLAWMAHADGWIFWYNRRWYDYTGTTATEMEGWGWRKVHHPDHVDRVVARVQRSWESGEPWEDTFPLKSRDGQWRWFLSRALPVRGENGQVLRWFGTNTDITELREADERQRLLLNELNHRVKNTLAAVQSLAKQSARNADSVDAFQQKFEPRLLALSRTHSLLARDTWQGAGLTEVISKTLDPFMGGNETGRIRMQGPEVRLGPTAAVTLGMAVHELATNAAIYGALSVPEGGVEITWRFDLEGGSLPTLDLLWRERNGPPAKPCGHRGFGTRLVTEGVARELDGEVKLDFEKSGAVCSMRLPLSRKVTIG
jgi:PAS domain S-box-containing protein